MKKFRFFVVGNEWMFVTKWETVEDDWELTAYYNEWQEKWEIKIRRKVWELKKNDDWWLVEEKEVKIAPEKFFDTITQLFREEVEKQ